MSHIPRQPLCDVVALIQRKISGTHSSMYSQHDLEQHWPGAGHLTRQIHFPFRYSRRISGLSSGGSSYFDCVQTRSSWTVLGQKIWKMVWSSTRCVFSICSETEPARLKMLKFWKGRPLCFCIRQFSLSKLSRDLTADHYIIFSYTNITETDDLARSLRQRREMRRLRGIRGATY